MTQGITSALAAGLLLAALTPFQADDAAIARHRAALRADHDDARAKEALKRLIDRPHPVQREKDGPVRAILREYPWPGKAAVAFPDEPGNRMIVSGVVRKRGGESIPGAILSVFQTDANGHYTRAAVMDEPHARLFAYLRTGADGRYEITTIRPGGYPGRADRQGEQWRIPEHIHFEITADGFQPRRFQMVFRDDPRMTPYWQAWAANGGHPIVTIVPDSDGLQRGTHDIALE